MGCYITKTKVARSLAKITSREARLEMTSKQNKTSIKYNLHTY